MKLRGACESEGESGKRRITRDSIQLALKSRELEASLRASQLRGVYISLPFFVFLPCLTPSLNHTLKVVDLGPLRHSLHPVSHLPIHKRPQVPAIIILMTVS